MSAYVISMIDVTDEENYGKYRVAAPVVTAKFGGKKIAGGANEATLEGDYSPARIVILEFPTVADAKAWHESAEYQEARKFRLGAADFRMLVVDGD